MRIAPLQYSTNNHPTSTPGSPPSAVRNQKARRRASLLGQSLSCHVGVAPKKVGSMISYQVELHVKLSGSIHIPIAQGTVHFFRLLRELALRDARPRPLRCTASALVGDSGFLSSKSQSSRANSSKSAGCSSSKSSSSYKSSTSS